MDSQETAGGSLPADHVGAETVCDDSRVVTNSWRGPAGRTHKHARSFV
jgi:hypothetical protein